jgi:hypothetical protein
VAAAVGALLVAPWVGPSSARADLFLADGDEPYVRQLVDEINGWRAAAGTAPLALDGDGPRAALASYVADLTRAMVATGQCFHGDGHRVASVWDYLAASGVTLSGGSEVLGCPSHDGYWTPTRIAERWWTSPLHHQLLYRDPNVNTLACGTYGPQRGGAAYQTVVCVAYRT